MTYGLILADNWNQYNDYRVGVRRNPVAHRTANFLREHAVEVDVIDFIHEYSPGELEHIFSLVAKKNPAFIAINTSMDKRYAQWDQLVPIIRQCLPGAKIIVFGERVVRKKYVGADYWVEGYAETAVLRVLTDSEHVITHRALDHAIVYATDYPNDLTANSFAIDFLPSDFIDSKEILPLHFSSGCIFKCAFCNHCAIGVRKSEHERTRDAVKNEMLTAYQRWGITKFPLTDSTFNDTREKAELLLEIAQLIPEPIEVACFLRLDILYRQPDVLDMLVQAGVKTVHFGLDSLNPATGRAIGKTVDPELLKEFLLKIKEQYPQLYVYGTFIVGLPQDSIENQWQTFNWIKQTRALDGWFWFPLSIKPQESYGEILSPIEQDLEHYGYWPSNQDISMLAVGRGFKDKEFKPVNWATNYTTLTESTKLCKAINSQSYPLSKFNPWMMFDASVVYQDINWWTSTHPGSHDFHQVKVLAGLFVNEYKKKKQQYFSTF